MKLNSKKIFNFKFKILIIVIILIILLSIVLNGCNIINQILPDSMAINENISPEIARINIDENELKNLDITNKTFNEQIDSTNNVKLNVDKLRDPFLPFYLNNNQNNEIQKNKIIVEKIYSENEVVYTEISLNDATYKLKKDDLFGKIYQVKAINADSVVLLKGDEYITVYMNEVYYD